jgi:hypothetical protein
MQLQIMCEQAKEAFERGGMLSLTVPRCWRPPTGFPKYEVLCENDTGRTVSIDPEALIVFLVDNGLVPASSGILKVPQ